MLIEDIIIEIKEDKENKEFTDKGWEPILMVNPNAKILIIGQAPGIKTQEKAAVFLDKSGERLRGWLQVSEKEFYESNNFAVLPLDFYYPGKAKTGDKPPRENFAQKWHPKLLELMPKIELILLTGTYAQKAYLKDEGKSNLTETVRNFQEYLPNYFPLIHPSPINQRWEKKNPFFKDEVLPYLQNLVSEILKNTDD